MRKYLSLASLLVLTALLASPAFGQQVASGSVPFTKTSFSLTGKALGYMANGTGLVAADAVADFQITPNLFIQNDNIILSTQASASIAAFSLGGVKYDLPLSNILKSTALNPANFKFYALGQAGSVTSAVSTNLAASAGFGLDYYPPSTPSVSVNLFQVQYLRGPVPMSNGSVVQNGVAVSVGISFK